MNELYYTIFIVAFPIMCFFTNFVVSVMLLFKKDSQKKEEGKRMLIIGAFGSVIGYLIALIYFYITREESLLLIAELACIGFLVGAGYTMILFSILPKKIRLKGIET